MKYLPAVRRFGLLGISLISTISLLGVNGVANAAATTTTKATDAERLQTIISKGNQEITRRLNTLNGLGTNIISATKLTAADKSTLGSEVNDAISGLTALKAKLDADTDLATARADAQSIYTEYRVYALVVPKVHLVKTADDQQVVEGKLMTLAGKLQTRITEVGSKGKDTTSLQTKLDDLKSKVSAAQTISSSVEASVIGLQPDDYNQNHTVLTGDNAKLQTAHGDNQAAIADAKNIVASLKSL